MSILKKLVGHTAIYGLSSIVGRLLNFLLVPLYTSIFTPGEYGVLSLLMTWVAFAMVVLSYGLETSFFHFSTKEKNSHSVFSTGVLSLLLSTSLFLLFVIPQTSTIAELLHIPENSIFVTFLAFIIAFDTMATLPFAKLRLNNKPWKFASVRIANICLNIGLNLFFFLLCPYLVHKGYSSSFLAYIYEPSFGIGYIFVSYLASSFLTLLLLLPEFFKIKLHFDFILWKKMLAYGFPLLIGGLAFVINEMIDKILLEYLLPADIANTQVGIYSACYKIAIFMSLFIQAYRYGVEPFFFAHAQKTDAKIQYAKLMRYFVAFTGLIFLGVNVYIDTIKEFIRDESYHVGLQVVPILLLAYLFLGIYFNLSVWYKVTDKTRYGAYLSIFGALVTIVLNFALIPSMSYVGSAYATLFCYFSMCVASYLLSRKHYSILYDFKRIFSYLFLAFGLLYFWSIFNQENFFSKYLFSTVLCIVYMLIVLVLEKQQKKQ